MLKNEVSIEGRKYLKQILGESLILFKDNHQGLLKLHICRFRFSSVRKRPGKSPKIGFCLKLKNNV